MYYCRGEASGFYNHCSQHKYPATEQCHYCKWYEAGNGLPHYPVPAIKLIIEVCPECEDSPFHNSVVLWECRVQCSCCDAYIWTIACIWDFDFNRTTDFNYECGVYVNSRQIEEGIELYHRYGKAGGHA